MTIDDFVELATGTLRQAGSAEPLSESLYLIAAVLDLPRAEILAKSTMQLTAKEQDHLSAALERRAEGVPLAYIVGYRDFYKSRFTVRSGVLIPRPESELIVDLALESAGRDFSGQALDVGCGSGCIGLSLLKEWPKARLTAIDIESTPIEVTLENAKMLGVADRIDVVKGDFSEVAGKLKSKFDLVVANPPYIALDDPNVESSVKKFEPTKALFSEQDGLADIYTWLLLLPACLNSGAKVLMEIGLGQSQRVTNFIEQQVPDLVFQKFQKDLNGIHRTLVAKRR